jgi:hypothetical protein
MAGERCTAQPEQVVRTDVGFGLSSAAPGLRVLLFVETGDGESVYAMPRTHAWQLGRMLMDVGIEDPDASGSCTVPAEPPITLTAPI